MRDRFAKFEEGWKSFEKSIKSVADELRVARYDGVTIRAKSNPYATVLETGLFLLPTVIEWKAVGEILVVPLPPEIRLPLEQPPLRCDPAWYPDWYTQKMNVGGMTYLEAALQRRSGLAEEGW